MLQQFLTLSSDEQDWLRGQLDRLVDDDYLLQNGTSNGNEPNTTAIWDDDDDEPLPERPTVDEAITLYLADKCSLGRAAELAGVTRWDIQGVLKEKGLSIYSGSEIIIEEMYDQIERLEERGIL